MTKRVLALLCCLALMGQAAMEAPVAAQSVAMARIDPARAVVGERVTIRGEGWPAGSAVTVTLGQTEYVEWTTGVAAPDGTLALTAIVPRVYVALSGTQVLVTPGDYLVTVISTPGGGRGTLAVAVRLTISAPVPAPPAIAARFHDYYFTHDGGRLLGHPISDTRLESGRRVQYFEKGRLEDHADFAGSAEAWRIQFGRLAAELATTGGTRPVGGNTSSVTYADFHDLAAPERRLPVPPDWSVVSSPEGEAAVFVPVDAMLRPAPGHYVPARFWGYITQPALFPAGWLHDIGLPLSEAVPATVTKTVAGEQVTRTVIVQLFERTVLTDDRANPDAFQIERANVGTDYLAEWRGPIVPGDVVLHDAFTWSDPSQTSERLPLGMRAPAWEWLSRPQTEILMEDEVAVLEQQLRAEGWQVTGRTGTGLAGTVEGVKGTRLQVIAWSHGPQPGIAPAAAGAGTSLRVLIGQRA
ncbi:MAG: hypothetical protein IT340_22625 [Chloroflexi bacterium]|nr:hypothetical protein [Chloroflexota bacterium]